MYAAGVGRQKTATAVSGSTAPTKGSPVITCAGGATSTMSRAGFAFTSMPRNGSAQKKLDDSARSRRWSVDRRSDGVWIDSATYDELMKLKRLSADADVVDELDHCKHGHLHKCVDCENERIVEIARSVIRARRNMEAYKFDVYLDQLDAAFEEVERD
jgi:hypothetical protein